jgi:hypothetical protein
LATYLCLAEQVKLLQDEEGTQRSEEPADKFRVASCSQ